MEKQKLGDVETIISELIHHANTNSNLVLVSKSMPQVLGKLFEKLPSRLEIEIEDLQAIYSQLTKIREVASQKGYSDILELFDQKLPYNGGY